MFTFVLSKTFFGCFVKWLGDASHSSVHFVTLRASKNATNLQRIDEKCFDKSFKFDFKAFVRLQMVTILTQKHSVGDGWWCLSPLLQKSVRS